VAPERTILDGITEFTESAVRANRTSTARASTVTSKEGTAS